MADRLSRGRIAIYQGDDYGLSGRFVRAWLHLIRAGEPSTSTPQADPPPSRGRVVAALMDAVAVHGPHTLALGTMEVMAPNPAAQRVHGRLPLSSAGHSSRYELDLDGSVWIAGATAASYADLEEFLSVTYRTSVRSELADALRVIDRYDTYLAAAVFEQACAEARAAVNDGGVGVLPTRDLPPPSQESDPDGVLSPDGLDILVTHHVRTRRVARAGGEPTVVLEGWWQIAPAWFSDGGYGVLCATGDFDLDRDDPEVAKLAALEAFPSSQRICKLRSAGLLHVFNSDNDYLYHIEVDAERIESTGDGRIVALTRSARGAKHWATVLLAVTGRGLVPLAKHPVDIGSLQRVGDRIFGSNGFELIGVDKALASVSAWRLTSIRNTLDLDPPPPPPRQRLTVRDCEAIELALSESERVWHQTSAAARAEYEAPRGIAKRSPSRLVVGSNVVSGSDDDLQRFVLVDDQETPIERAVEPAIVGPSFRADFSPDNQRCAVASRGALWDVDTISGAAEMISSSWPLVLSVQRDADACWALVRLFKAHCELARFARGDDGWSCTNRLPVEGFDRLFVGCHGRLVVVSIDNSPPDMAWSMLMALDDKGVLRHLGRLERVVTDVWDADGSTFLEMFGGAVYQLHGFDVALTAAVQAQDRPLLALVYDVPGGYGKREFLARFEHDFGYLDRNGNLAVEHRYTFGQDFDSGHASVAHCGSRLFGLIDTSGALVVPHRYSWIGRAHDGCRSVARGQPDILGKRPKDADWGMLGADGELILLPTAERVRDMAQGRAAVQRNGTWNLVTTEGTWLLETEATKCGNFHDGRCPVAIEDLWGVIDLQGRFVVEPMYEDAGEFRDGLAGVRLPGAGRWSFIDVTGAVVSDREVDEFFWHVNGFARVKVGGKWGFMDHVGELVIPTELDEVFNFHSGMAAARIGGRWTWIDTTGSVITDQRFDKTFNASEGVGIFEEGAFRGYMRADGTVIARELEGAFNMQEGLAPVKKRARWGYMNSRGELVAKHRFANALGFSEGLAAVKSAGKWGFIDASGAMAVLPTLGAVGSYSCGRARVHR